MDRALKISWYNLPDDGREAYLSWLHVSRMRKLVSVSGWAKHGVLYEFTSLEVRNERLPTLPKLYPEMEAWTNRFIPKLIHEPRSPNIACRIWPPAKN